MKANLSLCLLFGALAACAAMPPQPGEWVQNYPEGDPRCTFYNADMGAPKAEGGKSAEDLAKAGMTGIYARKDFDKRCSYY